MLMKIFPTGNGRGYGPVEYLCSENPFGKGVRSIPPQVMSGDPSMMIRLIDSSPYAIKYTSGVISHAKEDNPTNEQLIEEMQAIENLAFAGLPESSRTILWVKHKHAGRIELHFLIHRQEVITGKSFNAFPPGWQKKYDHVRDMFNHRYGWARPDDPERARHWQPGINAKIRDDAKRRNIKNPKDEILKLTDNLANMASSGNLKNRNEIISELRGRGYGISRQGKDYITIVDKDGKRTRLKGRLFMEDFNGPEWIKSENAKFSKPDSEKNRVDLELAAKAEAAFLEAVQRTALYNKRRYGVKEEPYDEINLNLETIFTVTSNLEQMEVIHDKPSKQHARNHESNFNTKEGGSPYGYHSGKQSTTAESTTYRRRKEKASQPSAEKFPAASAMAEKSIERGTNEKTTLFHEHGLGRNRKNGWSGKTREEDESLVRKIPLPERSLADMGRGTGERPHLEEENRNRTERLHEGCRRTAQNHFRAGTEDHGRRHGKPGRNDGTHHGDTERVTRQGFWLGEYGKLLEDSRGSTEKIVNGLNAHDQSVQAFSGPDTGLGSRLAEFRKSANLAISNLRLLNEQNLIRSISHHSVRLGSIDTTLLRGEAERACHLLRQVNEWNIIKKLERFVPSMSTPSLIALSHNANELLKNLKIISESKILSMLDSQISTPDIYDISDMKDKSGIMLKYLRQLSESKIFDKLTKTIPLLELPKLNALTEMGDTTIELLSKANNINLIQKIGNYAKRLHKNSKSVFETSIISARITQEQKRQLLINECLQRAAWAGDDLRKWNVIDETNKRYPEKREIMEKMMELAHAEFLSILEEVQNLTEIYERCKSDSFLLREYALVREEIQEISNNVENSEDNIQLESEEPEEFENYDDMQIESNDVEPEEFEDDEEPEFRMPRP